ncbi:MAG: hypothetical protein RR234_06545 [Christensenella sp.]
MTEKAKKSKIGMIIVIVILVAAIIALVTYMFVLKPKQEAQEEERQLVAEKNAEMGIIPGMSDEEVQNRLNQVVSEAMMNVYVNPNTIFPDGETEGNLRIENIPGNNYAVTVELIRDDNGKAVYTSGLIDPGYFVENVKLDVDLDAGKYPALALFTAYDIKTGEKMGSAGVRVNISVQN